MFWREALFIIMNYELGVGWVRSHQTIHALSPNAHHRQTQKMAFRAYSLGFREKGFLIKRFM